MRKRLLAVLLTLCMVIALLPTAVLADGETVGGGYNSDTLSTKAIDTAFVCITENGTVDELTATYSKTPELEWCAADASIGRSQDGWWIGAKVIAPSSVTAVTYGQTHYKYQTAANGSYEGQPVKYFDNNNDGVEATGTTYAGRYNMQVWGLVTPDLLTAAKKTGGNLEYKWHFDWDGDGTYETEYKIDVNPDGAKLKKGSALVYPYSEDNTSSYVAAVGDYKFQSFASAVAMANSGDTVTLLQDVTVSAAVEIDKSITLDLGGYKLTGPNGDYAIKVSAGNITIKNGSIAGYHGIFEYGSSNVTLNNVNLSVTGRAVEIQESSEMTIDKDSTVTTDGSTSNQNCTIMITNAGAASGAYSTLYNVPIDSDHSLKKCVNMVE